MVQAKTSRTPKRVATRVRRPGEKKETTGRLALKNVHR